MTARAVPPAGAHGDDALRVAAALGLQPEDVLDLATSMNPVAPDLRLIVAAAADSVRRYPDTTAATAVLAAALGAEPAEVLLTNGGSEAIALVAAELGRGRVDEPDFSLYRRHLSEVAPDAPRWRSNPHNPTGRLASAGEQAQVWDEAFYPLATGSWTRGDARTGSVALGSLTKLFACPGLRLGYVLSEDTDLIGRLAHRQPRWSVGSVALAVIPRMLELSDLSHWAKRIAGLRADLVAVLAEAGFAAAPSDANFVLVEAAPGLRDRLAREGVVVRDCTSFGMPDAVRIAVPPASGLEQLAVVLGVTTPSGARAKPTATGRAASPTAPTAPELTGALMVCGTASDVGKSQIVTGLCRLLARRGVRVAPFKAQNMSLNSFATPSGHEIGRAQGIQAIAAGVDPEVSMNPILLKPTGERRSQVVVMGRPTAELDAAAYQAIKRDVLLPVVLDALADLRDRYDVVICEGAGSPAEINLLDGDIANLSLANAAGIPAVLVGDIERGGVFASLFGTMALLPGELSRWVGGSIVNKFRGDVSLLSPGLDELERRTGVPCLGVLPYVKGLSLDAEDSLGLAAAIGGGIPGESNGATSSGSCIDVAAIALPHLANFTDLDALALEPSVTVRMVSTAAELGDPDLIIIPGSKTTVADLEWLRTTALGPAITALARAERGPTVLGICAGYQMLGDTIVDGVESPTHRVEGLGLLGVRTEFEADKLARPRRGRALGEEVTGYEIHQGRPVPTDASTQRFASLDDTFGADAEGVSTDGGRVAGTNLHGLFESDRFRHAYLAAVAERGGKAWQPSGVSFARARAAQIDRLADLIEEYLDVETILALIATATPGPAR
ncbi:MAG: cobyric acid synthase [Acidimicrobiales bacterium]